MSHLSAAMDDRCDAAPEAPVALSDGAAPRNLGFILPLSVWGKQAAIFFNSRILSGMIFLCPLFVFIFLLNANHHDGRLPR